LVGILQVISIQIRNLQQDKTSEKHSANVCVNVAKLLLSRKSQTVALTITEKILFSESTNKSISLKNLYKNCVTEW